jgi:heme-degrading monooxygenase HmoA
MEQMAHHLAQTNIARLVAPVGDPRLADFAAQLDPVNRLADAAPGFVRRLQSASGNATDIAYGDDPLVIVNMSVWESLADLRDYAYASRHVEVFRDRARWFEKMDQPHACLWWIPAGHLPTVAEGRERPEHYRAHSATEFAFWFSHAFPAPAEVGQALSPANS